MPPEMNPAPNTQDAGDDAILIELGPQLLTRFSSILRTARTYDVSNQAFQRQLHDTLAVILRGLETEDEITLVVVADYFYINGVRIKAQASLLSVYHSLMSEFERRTLGGLRFLQDVLVVFCHHEGNRGSDILQLAADTCSSARVVVDDAS